MNTIGRNGDLVLFESEGMGVVIHEPSKTVVSTGPIESLTASAHYAADDSVAAALVDLAEATITSLNIEVLSSSDRMHTIPKSVQSEAKRALEWRAKYDRGGTPVGLNTARTLARGGQIGIRKIRHIAKYFPRHEVDKKGKGYKPGDDGYPSKGRIAWGLWGGDAAQKWASAIVERENKKAVTAGAEFEAPSQVMLANFGRDDVQFMVRVRKDGSGVDRLYQIERNGNVSVWDDGCWDDLGNVDNDIDTYDRSLDDPYDRVEKQHLPVDAQTAVTLAALLDSNPFEAYQFSTINSEEYEIFANAENEINWSEIDAVMAAGAYEVNSSCPAPTGDLALNLKNRQNAIENVGYGPLNPNEPNDEFWAKKADRWSVTIDEAKTSLCGNCAGFNRSPKMLECIENGLKGVDGETGNEWDVIDAAELGYCEPLDFKCAASRTCDAWIVGGPITAAGEEPADGYTKEERAEKAEAQVRDKNGRFAKTGERVVVGGNPVDRGVIQKIDTEKKTAIIKLDSGMVVEAPVADTEAEDPNKPAPDPNAPAQRAVNTSGILGEPKTQKQRHIAKLPKKLPVIGQEELHEIIADFPTRVQKIRDKKRMEGLTAAGENKPKPDDYKQPKESDVEPIYMAVVADDDPQAVMDVIALVPASATSNEPTTFRREPGKWVRDDAILQDLNSPTPPPVVKMDLTTLEEVLKQVDSTNDTAGMVAAGGLDRNRGNAEKLRRYWLYGKGAAKIRWNTPGDWTRCVNNLSKYMGPRAKGYCALRHKEATGMWTGDKAHRQMTAGGYSDEFIISEQEVIENAITKARVADAKARVLTAGGYAKGEGAKFFIPLVIPEGMESGDKRIFDKGAITLRELPLPLLWQIQSADGHQGSVVVGRIDTMERTDDGIGNAHGVFDDGEYGKEAERLVRGGFIRGVSADLDKFEADEEVESTGSEEEGFKETSKIKIRKARVMAVTLVPKPAFQECTIEIEEDDQEEEVVPDGVYVEGVDAVEASALVACGMIAGAIPTTPPASWFENPKLKQATPLTVDEEGRVFGHIAAWHVDHIGMAFGTKPPRSRSNYAYFHTGIVRTEEGTDVPVGQLTLAGGHASLEMSAKEAVRHYDDTASAFADVHAGEDAYGIWVAGALRPGTTPEQVRAIRASAPSGDWRPIKGHLELVAVCQVNVPGFPIARARVASGSVMALVAAGANVLAHMKSDPVAELNARLDRLEQPIISAAEEARQRVLAVKAEELASRMAKKKKEIDDDVSWMVKTVDDDTEAELAVVSRRQRLALAKEGKALPDGSFPIRNVNDLRNAIRAYGRAGAGKKAKVRQHIMKRARGLGHSELIPENWPGAPKIASEAAVDEIPAEGIEAFAANDGPCWEGYEMVGWKMKDGKKVPNCVPVDASVEDDVDPLVASLRDRVAIVEAMVSAGGADRNRGNAEKLRRYWTVGAGAAKIRWGTPGDWKRCVRYLSKYLGARSKGYCQLRHKEATGVYTGSRLNPGRSNNVIEMGISEALLSETPETPTVVTVEDMTTPLEIILAEPDDLFDPAWEPEEMIVILLMEDDLSDDDDDVIDEDLDDQYEFDDLDTAFAAKDEIPTDLTPEEIEALKLERLNRGRELRLKKKGRYTAKTQPRDAAGKFRKVLARLKVDLGTAGLDRALDKVEEIENLDFSGDYDRAAKASGDLIDIIDRLDAKALNPESLENVRASSRELGKVIANLPFAFGESAQKIRFSDVPPALRDLIEDMITRVEAKIGKEDADIATQELRSFMSGGDYFNQSEISAQMSKLLRLLT